jgi:hypothetical protein
MSSRKSSLSRNSISSNIKLNERQIATFQSLVLYRDYELNLLNDLLIRSNKCLYPLIHVYGLSGNLVNPLYFIFHLIII